MYLCMYVCMYRYLTSIPSLSLRSTPNTTSGGYTLASLCEPRVLSQVSSGEIHGRRKRSGPGYSLSLFVIPRVIIIPPLFHTHLSPPPTPMRRGVPIPRSRQHITSTVTKLWASPFLAGHKVRNPLPSIYNFNELFNRDLNLIYFAVFLCMSFVLTKDNKRLNELILLYYIVLSSIYDDYFKPFKHRVKSHLPII